MKTPDVVVDDFIKMCGVFISESVAESCRYENSAYFQFFRVLCIEIGASR